MTVYNDPTALELETVAEIDYSDGDYCFDLRVVWLHRPSGEFYTARDSGCSCPSPFEEYHALGDLEMLSIPELEREAHGELRGTRAARTPAEVAHFLRVVREAVEPPRRWIVQAPELLGRYGWLEHVQ